MTVMMEVIWNEGHKTPYVSFKSPFKRLELPEQLECLTKIRIELEREASYVQKEFSEGVSKYGLE